MAGESCASDELVIGDEDGDAPPPPPLPSPPTPLGGGGGEEGGKVGVGEEGAMVLEGGSSGASPFMW